MDCVTTSPMSLAFMTIEYTYGAIYKAKPGDITGLRTERLGQQLPGSLSDCISFQIGQNH